MRTRTPPHDPGLVMIAELERRIVAARLETLAFHAVGAAEVERERATVEALAKSVGDGLRAEYLGRSGR